MKLLAARAKGDVLIFTDANVMLDPDAVDNLLARYADPEIGGVLGSLHYMGDGESATASVGSLYWRIEERLKDEESRTGKVLGADGRSEERRVGEEWGGKCSSRGSPCH